jgi:hypothetical protein
MPITQCKLFSTDDGSQLTCQPHQRGDVEACLALDFIADFARALDHDDAFQCGPIVAFLQSSDIVDCLIGSGFDAVVIAPTVWCRLTVVSLKPLTFCSAAKISISSRSEP